MSGEEAPSPVFLTERPKKENRAGIRQVQTLLHLARQAEGIALTEGQICDIL